MYVNGRQQVALIFAHLLVVVIGFVSATVLVYAGKLDSTAYMGLVGGLVGLIGGGAVLGHGVAVGSTQPHQADQVIANLANPTAGGRRSYDPDPPAGLTHDPAQSYAPPNPPAQA